MQLLGLSLPPFGVRRVVAPGQSRVSHLDVGPVRVCRKLLQQRQGGCLDFVPVYTVVEHLADENENQTKKGKDKMTNKEDNREKLRVVG